MSGDTNGDSAADFTIRLTENIALTAADFIGASAALPFGAAHSTVFQTQPDPDFSATLCLV